MGGASDAYPSCLDAFTELDGVNHWAADTSAMSVAVAAELVEDYPLAAALALRFVRYCRRSAFRISLTCGIRSAARLSALSGHPDESLRLWGGAEHTEAIIGLRYMPLMQRLDRPLLQQCNEALGPAATRVLAEGASLSVAELSQGTEETLLRLEPDENWVEPRGMLIAPPSGE
jgi:hypothetical protein